MIKHYWPSALSILVALTVAACNGTTGPTEVRNGSNNVLPSVSGGPSSLPADITTGPTECETIGIEARRVSSVSPGSVTLRVLASYTGSDRIYVRLVHVGSGEEIGVYPLGDITLSLSPGDYHIFIFVEVVGDDGLIQCDGSVRFTVPEKPGDDDSSDDDSSDDPPCEDCGPPPTCEELGTCPPPPTCEELGNCPEPPCVEDCEPPPCTEDCEPPPCEVDCDDDDSEDDDDCDDFSGLLCHATGTQNPVQLFFEDGIPPGHCKHFLERHSPGQGPKDFPGSCEEE